MVNILEQNNPTDTNYQIPSLSGAMRSRVRDSVYGMFNLKFINRYRDISLVYNNLVDMAANKLNMPQASQNIMLPDFNTFDVGKGFYQGVKKYGLNPLNLYVEQSKRIERLVQLWDGMTKEQREAISGFTSSLKTFVDATFSIKTAFQLSDRMSDIKQLSKIEGEESRDIVLLRNIYRRKGTSDDDFIELQKKLSGLTTALKLDPEKVAKDKDYQFFARYNGELNKTSDANGKRYGALDRQHQLEAAIKRAQANKVDPDLIKAHLDAIVGEKIAVKVYAVITDPNAKAIEAEEAVNADRQDQGMPAAQHYVDIKTQAINSHESVSGGISIPFIQPIVSNVAGLINAALNKYPDEIGKIQGGAAVMSEGTKWLEFAYKAYKGVGAAKEAFYPNNSDWKPSGPKRVKQNRPPAPPSSSDDSGPDPAQVTGNKGSMAGDITKFGVAAATAAVSKTPEHETNFVERLQKQQTALTRGGAIVKSTVNAKKHGSDYIPSPVKGAAEKAVSKVKDAATNIEKKLKDPSVQKKLLEDLETIFIIILKRYVPSLRNVPTPLLLPGNKQIIANNDYANKKRNVALNQQASNYNPILGGANPEIAGLVVKAGYRLGIPRFDQSGMNNGAFRTRNLAMDMQHAGQASKLSQEINNQQYHTVINVTPANADPMRVAEIVYNKVKQASFGHSKSVPSTHATQMTMV
ncbi:hypothetical protein [Commensalibacter intestini]|nr:hypothetical protein [Commensalibacter intestini]